MSRSDRKIRLLTFTNLYPNAVQPGHGLFVERRLQRLIADSTIEAVVVAPVPRVLGRYGAFREIVAFEWRHGVQVHHPRFLTIPGLGRFIAPFTMMFASLRLMRRLLRRDGFDVIDAHYFYPDGVAAALLAKIFGKPLVITARGSDVNLLPEYFFSRVLIRWAASRASRIITVSEALRERLIGLGIAAVKILTLRNGVDSSEFRPLDYANARRTLRWSGQVLLSVGNLVESKGHHRAIEALAQFPGTQLVVVGLGPYEGRLIEAADRFGVADRVQFAGALDREALVGYYSAADALVLASSMEGMPNVLLEALSCGLPVIATDCGGIREILVCPELGRLVRVGDADALVQGIREVLAVCPDRTSIRAYGERLGWDDTIRRQRIVYAETVDSSGR